MVLRLSTFAADVRGVVLAGLSTATNAAIAATDTVLVALGKLQAQLANYAALTGANFTGNVNAPQIIGSAGVMLGGNTSTGYLPITLNGVAASVRYLQFLTAGSNRWQIGLLDGASESGSAAGATLAISAFDNSGNYLSSPISINRATGVVSFTGGLSVGGSTTLAGAISTAPIISEVEGGLGAFRIATPTYGIFDYSDDGSYYKLITPSGAPLGTYGGLRPLIINLATGAVTMLDGLTVGSGLSTDTLAATNGTFSGGGGSGLFVTGSGADSGSGGNSNLQIVSTPTSGGEAVLAFNRASQVATKLSLTSDGYMAFGGWSWTPKVWKTDGSGNTIQLGAITFVGTLTGTSAGMKLSNPGGVTSSWTDTTAATDAKIFDMLASGGNLYFRAVNDAYSAANGFLTVNRSGYTITGITLAGANIALTGNVAVSGTLSVTGTVSGAGFTPLLSPLLPKAGGTMTGPIVLAADPAAALQPATKQYVDAANATHNGDIGRNLFHNGLDRIQQRGAGPLTAVAGYLSDRWYISGTGTRTCSIVTLSDTDRGGIGDEAAQYAINYAFTGGSGASDYEQFYQVIESVRRVAGKTLVVSFWARANSGTPKIGVGWTQSFGTGGSPSASVSDPAGQAVTLSTIWTRYTVTLTPPSVSGKTFGSTAGTDGFYVQFYLSSGSTYAAQAGVGVQSNTIQIFGRQCEIGSIATPLEKLDIRYEWSNCQRFYQTGQLYVAGYGTAGTTAAIGAPAVVIMRAVPTMILVTNSCANTAVPTLGASLALQYASAPVSATGGYSLNVSYSASADLT